MHARSALFDVYGDHLRGRGSQAPVAGLVRLLDPVGIQPPAVRTAISRMVAQGWLEPVRLPAGRGYRATGRAIRWLDDVGAADLPPRRADLGRPLAPGPGGPAGRPRGPQPAPRRPDLRRLRRAGRPRVGEPVRAGGARRGAAPGRVRPPGWCAPTRSSPSPIDAWDLAGPGRGVPLLRGEGRHVARRTSSTARRPGRGGLRRAVPPRARVAQVPVHRSRAARRAAARRLAGPARPPSCSPARPRRLKPAADRFVAPCLD